MESSNRSGGHLLLVMRSIIRERFEDTIPADWILLRHLHALTLSVLSLQIATGILLMVNYRPAVTSAFPSLVAIVDETYFGWLIRSIHGWGIHFLVLLVFLNLVVSYFGRAYQGPRVVDWTASLLTLFCLLGFGLTGMLLPWSQHAYWSSDLVMRSASRIPVLGTVVFGLIFPETEIGDETLLRSYVFHVGILPWITVLLLGLHFWITRRADRPEIGPRVSFSDYASNTLIASLLLFGVIVSVAVLAPPLLSGPAESVSPPPVVRMPWYLLPLCGLGAMWSAGGAAVLAVLGALLLFAVPVFDRAPAEPAKRPIARWFLGTLFLALCLLAGLKGYFQ